MEYFRFRLKSGDRHDVHSPFTYTLIEGALKKTGFDPEIEKCRAQLLKSNKIIAVEDHGTGKSRKRKVSDIAKGSLKRKKEASKIASVCSYLKIRDVYELGTSLGITSAYLSRAKDVESVITIEGSAEVLEIAKEQWKNLNLENITPILGDFDEHLPGLLSNTNRPTLYFIDGNHSYEASIRYFESIAGYTHEFALLIFDDIYWSDGMKQAWEEIIASEKVTLSIDLFEFGMAFIIPRMSKEHFILRY